MDTSLIHSCHLGPEISSEKLIPEHFFMYLLKGSMTAYDGRNTYTIRQGQAIVARKYHLIRYSKQKEDNVFDRIVIALDEAFLRLFLQRHSVRSTLSAYGDSLMGVKDSIKIRNYISSLAPYQNGFGAIEEGFTDVKREELLLILLKENPELSGILFNFGAPQKIDLEAFMNRNFRFNVGLNQFAFLTGRSLSAFKRDFHLLFNTTPGNWLTGRRLEEAYFQILNGNKNPGEVYLEVGFENQSHFSWAFKKRFGRSPAELLGERQAVSGQKMGSR